MSLFKKSLFAIIFLALPSAVLAKNINFDLKLKFREAIAIQDVVAIDYGSIGYNGSASGNDIKIDPADASITCTNNTDYSCPTSGVRGQFRVTGEVGLTVEISCDDTAQITFSGEKLDIVSTEVRVGASTNSCSDLNTISASHVLANTALDDTFFVGGTIEIPATGLAALGAYSSTNPAGNAVKVRVRYQ